MEIFGRGRVSDLIGDRIVYRNLVPMDPRLPSLTQLQSAGLASPGAIPRKGASEYAQVVLHILKAACSLLLPGTAVQNLIFIGDTRRGDGQTFDQLCQVSGLHGAAFIGDETSAPAETSISFESSAQPIFQANRWALLADPGESGFRSFCAHSSLQITPGTALVLDLDKTTLAARGRNAKVIDQARIQAVQLTVAELLGAAFSLESFQAAYYTLDQPRYHSFTADNQDYLAYICLILESGLFTLQEVVESIDEGRLRDFSTFLYQVEAQVERLPPALADLHRDIRLRVEAGDPTPFKAFRRNEYLQTIQRIGCLPDQASVESMLEQEILITSEVYRFTQECLTLGAMVIGLSDKPDEASIPTQEQAAQGFLPIHRAVTHIVGEVPPASGLGIKA